MDDKSKVKKEVNAPLGPPPPKRGLKFAPKVPVKKAAKLVPKKEPVEDSKDETINKELLMKLKASQITDPFARRIKTEEKPKSRTQVAFGQGNSSYARSFLIPKSSSDEAKLPKEYAEPWVRKDQITNEDCFLFRSYPLVSFFLLQDYTHTDYPVSLPLRRPYSGNPEILDEEEFGESSASRAQDAELTAAEELGLMDRSDESQLLLVQLPCSLPLPMQPQSVSEPNKGSKETREGMKLKELPAGYMGKILVYRSGKVKMKIGDILFDVSSGSDCKFVQEVAAINTREKHCCTVGEISKRAVITPNIGCLLGSANKMEE
ncbi:hypothetical protein PAHAL_7G128400 [Panicum hallii]|uniref:DNA-directed RNA polymerase III subunit RPC4 n=1 Tax=Panicum hallii TaxID=206008 RepID=A0A2S3I6A5_9POAL|nr:uncharacterized protein LOC112900237 isoform X1 [Panicum hallii]PAN37860.1 hypothetical protein PAHAL_7G128400 [Panicum hallii]